MLLRPQLQLPLSLLFSTTWWSVFSGALLTIWDIDHKERGKQETLYISYIYNRQCTQLCALIFKDTKTNQPTKTNKKLSIYQNFCTYYREEKNFFWRNKEIIFVWKMYLPLWSCGGRIFTYTKKEKNTHEHINYCSFVSELPKALLNVWYNIVRC